MCLQYICFTVHSRVPGWLRTKFDSGAFLLYHFCLILYPSIVQLPTNWDHDLIVCNSIWSWEDIGTSVTALTVWSRICSFAISHMFDLYCLVSQQFCQIFLFLDGPESSGVMISHCLTCLDFSAACSIFIFLACFLFFQFYQKKHGDILDKGNWHFCSVTWSTIPLLMNVWVPIKLLLIPALH